MRKILAIVVLVRLSLILLPHTLRIHVSIHPKLQGDEARVRIEQGRYTVMLSAEARFATFVHELYHVAQSVTGQVQPVPVPGWYPAWATERLREQARSFYPAERVEHEVAAQSFAEAVTQPWAASA